MRNSVAASPTSKKNVNISGDGRKPDFVFPPLAVAYRTKLLIEILTKSPQLSTEVD